MLEKNKNCIEFSIRSMVATHKPYQEDTEIAITGMAPGKSLLWAKNPFDSPCDVVMIPKRDFEKLQSNADCNAEIAKQWERNYNLLLKKTGFDTVESLVFYLTSVAECDTLHEAISKLKDQVKYTCDEWYSANSRNNSWKAVAECNTPKELIEKIEGLEGKVKVLETEAEVYSRALQEWKDVTGYPSPSAVKTALESGASWCHAYNEVKAANEKLADDIKSWKNVTGYSTPEDYMHARISGAFHTPFDYTAAWKKATGCNTPDEVETTLRNLRGRIDEMKEFAAIASNWTDRIVED